MRRSALTLLLAAGMMVATTASAQSYSFETPSNFLAYNPTGYAGVTFAGTSGVALQGSIFQNTPPDGTHAAFIQTTAANGPAGVGAVSFALAGLTAGATYATTFYAAQRPNYGTGGSFDNVPINVSFDGLSLGIYTALSQTFTQFTVPAFVASGSTGTLTFTGVYTPSGDADVLFDLVNVQRLAAVPSVPEPAAWAMMIVGFGTAGFAARRRRAGSLRAAHAD